MPVSGSRCARRARTAIAATVELRKIARNVPAIMRLPAASDGFAEPMLALVGAPAANS
jgi:hypothetical protein